MDLHALPGEFFGAEVRGLREDRGWSQAELAERIGYSDALVGYIETNQRTPTERFAAACDSAFDTDTCLSRLCRLARHFATPHASLADLQRSATSLQLADPLLVPSLMQTEDYARAALQANCLPEDIADELLASRLRLVDLLEHTPSLGTWAVIDETSLYRPVGSRETLRLQLKELITLVDTGRVIIQVLKTTSPMTPLLRQPHMILGFADGTSLAWTSNVAPSDTTDRYAPADASIRAFDLLRAAALPPGISRGLIASATR